MNAIETGFEGLHLFELDVHSDTRGSFREAFHLEKMHALGLPALNFVQQNVSHSRCGVIRGIHAEPWEKFVHVASGRVFIALLDMRAEAPTFGDVFTTEMDDTRAILIPRGFGNSFQVLTDLAVYTYLVSDHWRPGVSYPSIAYDDPELSIAWPLTPDPDLISAKDKSNPSFADYQRTIGM